jgi:hypothetical protein
MSKEVVVSRVEERVRDDEMMGCVRGKAGSEPSVSVNKRRGGQVAREVAKV